MKPLIALFIIILISVSGCTLQRPFMGDYNDTLSIPPQPQPDGGQSGPQEQQWSRQVEPNTGPPYKSVADKPAGWFTSGQEADMVLYATGFGESGGPFALNHPGKVKIIGEKLIVSDTNNNRVLIWNRIPQDNETMPDLVLGQKDFNTNTPGLAADEMNWPMGIASDGSKLLVADANNYRVLIWNAFPTQNGQPADIVLGAPGFGIYPKYNSSSDRSPETEINWPWEVWTDGRRVAVTSHEDGKTLIWTEFPTENNQPADLVLGAEDFESRYKPADDSISKSAGETGFSSDGRIMAGTSYNQKSIYFWDRFADESGEPARYVMDLHGIEERTGSQVAALGAMGVDVSGGRIVVAATHKVLVWNSFPGNETDDPDLILGKQYTRDEVLLAPDRESLLANGFARPFGVSTDSRSLTIADTNNNRVLIYNTFPEGPEQEPDVILGQPWRYTSRNSFHSGGLAFSDGEKLAMGVDGYGVYIYSNIPDESRAHSDVVIGKLLKTIVAGGMAIIAEGKLIMAHREGSSVMIWNSVPEQDYALPDVILGKEAILDNWGTSGSGRSALNGPMCPAFDGQRLYVTDWANNRVLVWNSIPTANQTPADMVLGQPDFEAITAGNTLAKFENPTTVSTDGQRLIIADGNSRILVYKKLPTYSGQAADFEIKVIDHDAEIGMAGIPVQARLSLPAGAWVFDSKLFVADTGNNRVLIWSRFPENETDEPDIVLGQPDFRSYYPRNTADGLFVPAYLTFDGSHLWVSETKWSNRVLRYSVK